MYVRQLIGRQAGEIVEMPFADAKVNVDAGTAEMVSDDEIHEAGFQAAAQNEAVHPDQLLSGYRIEPAEEGGFDLFDAGGVKINKDATYHNHIEAREAAVAYARRARGMPSLFDPTGVEGPGSEDDAYEKLTVEELRAESDRRGLDSSGASKKADWVKLLKRDDKVKAALAAGDFEALTVAELTKIAADQNIDLTGKTAKPDVAEAVKAGYKAA